MCDVRNEHYFKKFLGSLVVEIVGVLWVRVGGGGLDTAVPEVRER
jgi:hypothetical protein